MSAAIKSFAPVLLMCGIVAWCCWPHLAGDQQLLAPTDAKAPQRITRDRLNPPLSPASARDTFQPTTRPVKPVEAEVADVEEIPAEPEFDLRGLFEGAELDGVFMRGKRRFALVSGELWEQGVPKMCSDETTEPCVATLISDDKIVIEHQGQSVELVYHSATAGPAGKVAAP